ncbi:UNVERIFIED_CONTAM: hypothetical protein FKN15_063324 [Acipenser sinensis]
MSCYTSSLEHTARCDHRISMEEVVSPKLFVSGHHTMPDGIKGRTTCEVFLMFDLPWMHKVQQQWGKSVGENTRLWQYQYLQICLEGDVMVKTAYNWRYACILSIKQVETCMQLLYSEF